MFVYHSIVLKGEATLRGYGMNIKNGFLNFVKIGLGDEDSGVSVTVGTWQHLAVSWDTVTDEVKYYRNGTLRITQTDADDIIAPLDIDNLSIGSWVNGTESFFDGLIDEVRIYNRALTPAEIKILAAGHPMDASGEITQQDTLDVDGTLTIGGGVLITDGQEIDVEGTMRITGTLDATTGTDGATTINAAYDWDMSNGGVFLNTSSTVIFDGGAVIITTIICSSFNPYGS